MKQLVEQGKRDFRVRSVLKKIIASCQQKDYACYAQAIHNFCRDKIKYVYDPVNVELVESPWDLLQSGIGDCDSKCILFCTFCEQAGFPCRFKTIKSNPQTDEYTHVYSQVKLPGQGWVASDTTMPDKDFGWEPPPNYESRVWPISDVDEPEDKSGGSSMPSSWFAGMSALDCDGEIMCQKCFTAQIPEGLPVVNVSGLGYIPASGLRGLSAAAPVSQAQLEEAAQSLDKSTYSFLKSYLDGSVKNALLNGAQRVREMQRNIVANQGKVNSIADFQKRMAAQSKLKELIAVTKDARASLNQAIAKSNEISDSVNYWSDIYGFGRPMAQVVPVEPMPGLGHPAILAVAGFVSANPLAGVALALIGLCVLIIGLIIFYTFAEMVARALGLSQDTGNVWNGFSQTLAAGGQAAKDVAGAGSSTISTIGIFALLGVAAYVGVKYLGKKGTI